MGINEETIKILISILSLVISCFAFYNARMAKKNSEVNTEFSIFGNIESSHASYVDICTKKDKKEIIKEKLCNNFEVACICYLKNRIDKKVFLDLYDHSIVDLVEDDNFEKQFPRGKNDKSDYEAIMRVYRIIKKKQNRNSAL